MSRRKRKPLPQEPATVEIVSLSHEGRGIGQIDGKTVFVQNALPGETVSFKYTYVSGKYDEGVALTIENPSIDRATPPCPHYDMCGGCSLQHMSMDAQLQLKQNTLLEQFKHFGNLVPHKILAPLHAQSLGYRRKARLGVRHVLKKEKVLVGFRERNGRYLTDMDSCDVLHPAVGHKIKALSELIDQLDCKASLPQIEVAISEETTALTLRHLVDLSAADTALLIDFAKTHAIEFYGEPNKPNKRYKLYPDDNNQRLSYRLTTPPIEILYHPSDFTQVNAELNEKMIIQALHLLDCQPGDNILDLFCGIGNFTLPIARYAEQVTGVEGTKSAVDRAQENARHNHIKNVQFTMANLFEDCSQYGWATRQYDKVLLDPPRSGAEEIIKYMPGFKAKRIVYISCNPATLARDAGYLCTECGYTLVETGIMNMFPHTGHVESIALFIKE
jgi:23S rRNA (uracil1939-C5)-methyltransferase